MSGRDEFFDRLRRALGRATDDGPGAVAAAAELGLEAGPAEERATAALVEAEARADELLAELEASAAASDWKVARVRTLAQAGRYVASLAGEIEARSVVCSAHEAVNRLNLAERFEGTGIDLRAAKFSDDAGDRDRQREALRQRAIEADLGVTGVDYAVAETGSCVLLAREGVSRLVSLLPPVHVAVVERGQVLPSLDELFALRRQSHLAGDGGSYMNIITGPSRSADIEQTLVTGVHGPGEVHMVLVG